MVILQSDSIFDDDECTIYNEDKAFFYIILNGTFQVSSINFNRKKKDAGAEDAGPGVSQLDLDA